MGGFLELETFKNKYFENEFSNSYEVLARSTGFSDFNSDFNLEILIKHI